MYWKYLKYVLRHKWLVMIECFSKGLFWQGIMHDISKLRPSEFVPYARYFYGNNGDIKRGRDKSGAYRAGETIDEQFNYAWLLHQKRNKHHWQYWSLSLDDGGTKLFKIPGKYVDEMICDWNGAGRAITGKENTLEWYRVNREHMQLNPETRCQVEVSIHYIK